MHFSLLGSLLDPLRGQNHALARALCVFSKSTLAAQKSNFVTFEPSWAPPGRPKSVLKKSKIGPRPARNPSEGCPDEGRFRSAFLTPPEFPKFRFGGERDPSALIPPSLHLKVGQSFFAIYQSKHGISSDLSIYLLTRSSSP